VNKHVNHFEYKRQALVDVNQNSKLVMSSENHNPNMVSFIPKLMHESSNEKQFRVQETVESSHYDSQKPHQKYVK
jgi:hypothetical protein